MTIAQLSKVRLEYFRHGEGPERVVFIHGFQSSAPMWRMTQQALPADRYTSIAINNRGAGASEAPPDDSDFGVQVFAEDAFELVGQLGWSDFTLVGHSMGGATVAQFAVDHPGLLKGLVLLDPANPDGGLPLPPGMSVEAVIERQMAARQAQQARGGGADGVDAVNASVPAELMSEIVRDMRAAPERRLRGSMRSMLTLRIGERLKTLPMPVLLVGGDADALVSVTSMLDTWSKLPAGSGLHFWHGVGHSPNLERPAELAALLRRFIETTIPARAAMAAG